MTPSNHVGRYQHFGGTSRLHLQDRSEDIKIGNHLQDNTAS
jgi:hypothetical protein